MKKKRLRNKPTKLKPKKKIYVSKTHIGEKAISVTSGKGKVVHMQKNKIRFHLSCCTKKSIQCGSQTLI